MMSKLTTQDESQIKQFKPKIYQGKRRRQTRNFYDRHSYDQRNFKIGIDQTVEIGEYCSVEEYNMDRIIEIALGIIKIIELILGEETYIFKHIELRTVPPFLPLNTKISGQTGYIKDRKAIHLTEDHVYKKTESASIINIDTIEQEIDQEVDEIDDTNGKVNPYHEIIVNETERDDTIISQMEQWSTLSKVVNYMQYNRHPKYFYNLDIRAVEQKRYKKIYNKEEDRQILE